MDANVKDRGIEVLVTVKLSEERVQDLLISAFEGGSSYWAMTKGE